MNLYRVELKNQPGELARLGDVCAQRSINLELAGVVSLELAAPAQGPERVVLVSVRARDRVSGGVFSLRYRLRLVREDRWYVAAINPTGG